MTRGDAGRTLMPLTTGTVRRVARTRKDDNKHQSRTSSINNGRESNSGTWMGGKANWAATHPNHTTTPHETQHQQQQNHTPNKQLISVYGCGCFGRPRVGREHTGTGRGMQNVRAGGSSPAVFVGIVSGRRVVHDRAAGERVAARVWTWAECCLVVVWLFGWLAAG